MLLQNGFFICEKGDFFLFFVVTFHPPFKPKRNGQILSCNSAAIPLFQPHHRPRRNWMSERSKTHKNRQKAEMQMTQGCWKPPDSACVLYLPMLFPCFGFALAAVFLLEHYQSWNHCLSPSDTREHSKMCQKKPTLLC